MKKIEKLLKRKIKNIFGLKEAASFIILFALLFLATGAVVGAESNDYADEIGEIVVYKAFEWPDWDEPDTVPLHPYSQFGFTVNDDDPYHFTNGSFLAVNVPYGPYKITEADAKDHWKASYSEGCEGIMGEETANNICIITNTYVSEKKPEPELEPEEEVLGEEIVIDCGIYLREYIKYGADNNPEEVKKLQHFLNEQMETGLPVTGFYGELTKQAVKEFQTKYQKEILEPWVDAGVHCHNQPTGYVYKTTQRKINLIMCPELNIPMPDMSAYPQTDCTTYWAAVMGEDIILEEGELEGEPEDTLELDLELDPETDPEAQETEETEEEREIPWLLILIIILLIIGFGWMLSKNKGGKRGTGFSGKKPTPPQSKSNLFESKSAPFESKTIPLGGKKSDPFEKR